MPVRTRMGQDIAGCEERSSSLEREVKRLRQEVAALHRQMKGVNDGGNATTGWLSIAMAAIALLLGIVAILRH